MLAGKPILFAGHFVNAGDTLIIQEGVIVNFTGASTVPVGLGVKGTLYVLAQKINL
jgi:hypothetical protein